MLLLPQPVPLHDIENAEAFVRSTIRRSGVDLTESEREDLVCEGLALLFELADQYTPHRAGYQHAGRFSGYASQFLPRRLGDAWHRSHPNHRYVTDPETGRRRWHYDPPAVSLDAITSGRDRGDGHSDRQLARARELRDFVPAISAQATAANLAAASQA